MLLNKLINMGTTEIAISKTDYDQNMAAGNCGNIRYAEE